MNCWREGGGQRKTQEEERTEGGGSRVRKNRERKLARGKSLPPGRKRMMSCDEEVHRRQRGRVKTRSKLKEDRRQRTGRRGVGAKEGGGV